MKGEGRGEGVPRFIGDLGASRSAELVLYRAVSQTCHLAYAGNLDGDSDSDGDRRVTESARAAVMSRFG